VIRIEWLASRLRFSNHRLSPDAATSGLNAFQGDAFRKLTLQRQLPHRLLAAQLNELHHKLQQSDQKCRPANYQKYHGFNLQTASPAFPSRVATERA